MKAGIEFYEFTPDNLVIGGPLRGQAVVVATGQVLVRGAVLGKITKAAASVGAAAGNVGDGEMGAIVLGPDAKVGDYVLTCVEEAANADRFKVIDPDGYRLDDLTVGQAYSNDHLGMTLADGAEDFDAGDTFTITVAAGNGKYVLSLAAAVDGSQAPVAILADQEGVDATAGDLPGMAYDRGEFNGSGLTLGAGHTLAGVTEALRDRAIYITSVIV